MGIFFFFFGIYDGEDGDERRSCMMPDGGTVERKIDKDNFMLR